MRSATDLLIPFMIIGIIGCTHRNESTTQELVKPKTDTKVVARPFAWPMNQEHLPTRGGTSKGAPVSLSPSPSPVWTALVAMPADRERDRAAIKAMAGNYRTAFDFQEVVGFRPGYQLSAPYFSWATERVFVIEDTPTKIVLQHQLVMRFDGHPGAMVVKHWRQDWTWEDGHMLRYLGHAQWEREQLPPEAVKGCWTQIVYGVGDEPRYSSVGKWQHDLQVSSWTGDQHWRPRPRREKSIRKDYDVLEGHHRITITPDGWTLWQDNRKVVVSETGVVPIDGRIAAEIGFERYQRLDDFDWTPGITAWDEEKERWAAVRDVWKEVLTERVRLSGEETVGVSLLEAVANETPDSGPAEVREAVVKPTITPESPGK